MPSIYLCFLWHMHQPFYKDLISGQYRLPWTRLHALKDYYGMVRILEEFPRVRQTFNLVPSLMVQVEEYAAGAAQDPFLQCALKPAEDLSGEEQEFILRYFFQANPARMIARYPRYRELYEDWLAAGKNVQRARRFFGVQAFRDLQVLSQVAWFDEEFLSRDAEVIALVEKGRGYSPDDQVLMGRKQLEIMRGALTVYKDFAKRGQIELSTTPFYHPILPLLCDSNIAQVSHPGTPLPSRFRYPEDARLQVEKARTYMKETFGLSPAGLWPSEGSVSDEALAIASDAGFQWVATDNGVLSRTLGSDASPAVTYRPYRWAREDRRISMLFRDHHLSDLIGFVYSRMDPAEAAADFLGRIRENCRAALEAGKDSLAPIILDGENAWDYYSENGRPFLRELYHRISQDPQLQAVTVSEALERMDPEPLDHIFPGSWIQANFDVWIGAEEDNRAWEYLLRARQTYERIASAPGASGIAEDRLRLAREELLIAEGSDWCWWYGPEHDSENRPEFDQLFRDHLANVYRALGMTPPDELSRPILQTPVSEFHSPPSGPIHPVIDGEVTSFFEWLGAGVYRVDARSGAMHGQRRLIRELHYGSDGVSFFLRLDFEAGSAASLPGTEIRVGTDSGTAAMQSSLITLRLAEHGVTPIETHPGAPAGEFSFRNILEIRLPLGGLGVSPDHPIKFQVSVWQDGLPVDALPPQGWIECRTPDPSEWPA